MPTWQSANDTTSMDCLARARIVPLVAQGRRKMSTNDPANYRRLSEPFPNQETAQRRIGEFWDAVAKLRNDMHITDVHIIVRVSVIYDANEEGIVMTAAHFGNSIEAEGMCAWALGQEAALRETTIGKLLKGAHRL